MSTTSTGAAYRCTIRTRILFISSPTARLAEKTILNYSEPTERFKNTISFVVEHSASPELVSRLVLQSLEQSRYVLRDPKPDMNVMGFTDLGMEYRIRYFFDWRRPLVGCSGRNL